MESCLCVRADRLDDGNGDYGGDGDEGGGDHCASTYDRPHNVGDHVATLAQGAPERNLATRVLSPNATPLPMETCDGYVAKAEHEGSGWEVNVGVWQQDLYGYTDKQPRVWRPGYRTFSGKVISLPSQQGTQFTHLTGTDDHDSS
ncbi:hypothetical protein TcWFU_001120 [Taenia crassiceps]|uniref:Uncharacterized protein n=1 Tax=Taenia crassiceps TaxID=6207 RepID=A0ABR4QG76_9CEST